MGNLWGNIPPQEGLFPFDGICTVDTLTQLFALFACSARYRGHGTDLSKVPDFQRHENDSGSPEAQIARMSARVSQLTEHLRAHKTDYSTRRGLMAVLSKRKQLLKYLRSKDKAAYERCISELGIRQLKAEV